MSFGPQRPPVTRVKTSVESLRRLIARPTSSSAVASALSPDRHRSGFVVATGERLRRSKTRTDQLADTGSHGGPLSQGCVANAPTAGAGTQTRPSDVVAALAR